LEISAKIKEKGTLPVPERTCFVPMAKTVNKFLACVRVPGKLQ
jgi:hypothetical protein